MEATDISSEEPAPDSPPFRASQTDVLRVPERFLQGLASYPFARDAEFQTGLAAIFGHPEQAVTPEEVQNNEALVLQAQCFFFSRHYNIQPPIDVAVYKSWLTQTGASPAKAMADAPLSSPPAPSTTPPLQPNTAAAAAATAGTPSSLPLSNPPNEREPPYPPSFAQIVDLITSGAPIPGIVDVPPTVLGLSASSKDTTPKRRKPWEDRGETQKEETEQQTTVGSEATEQPVNAWAALQARVEKMADSQQLQEQEQSFLS